MKTKVIWTIVKFYDKWFVAYMYSGDTELRQKVFKTLLGANRFGLENFGEDSFRKNII